MNDQEKYLFDLRGYLVVENALSSTQVRALSDTFERDSQALEAGWAGSDRYHYDPNSEFAWSCCSLLEYGGPYIDLIDLPSIVPYLEALLGPHYRLDHDYLKVDRTGPTGRPLYLHGGGQGAGRERDLVGPHDGGQCYYRYNNDRMYNGLVSVAFELKSIKPGDGGFACIAGSHKANFGLPEEWRFQESQENMHECVDRVAVDAGDAIIFTEALTHGTLPWGVEDERSTVFYKFSPHTLSWSADFFDSKDFVGYEDMDERKLALLEKPNARYLKRPLG